MKAISRRIRELEQRIVPGFDTIRYLQWLIDEVGAAIELYPLPGAGLRLEIKPFEAKEIEAFTARCIQEKVDLDTLSESDLDQMIRRRVRVVACLSMDLNLNEL